jgi:hypothetical protein
MPLIRDYIGDSNIYGLKGHSTFMSVCKFRSFMKRNLRSSHTNSFSRKLLLPTRPSATKHSPNRKEKGAIEKMKKDYIKLYIILSKLIHIPRSRYVVAVHILQPV